MSYSVAIGHNRPQEELTVVSPIPSNGEVKVTQRDYSDSGPHDQGLYSEPEWPMIETDEQFQGVLAQFGVLDAETCDITWYARDHAFRWKRYNGTAKAPQPGVDGSRTGYFLSDYRIVISDLVEIEE